MAIRKILFVLLIAVTSAFGGFILGFHEGSRASLWSDFVLKGVIAGQRLEALEKGDTEFLRSTLRPEIDLGIQSHSELIHIRGYGYLSPLTGIELYGLRSEYVSRLEQYKKKWLHPSTVP